MIFGQGEHLRDGLEELRKTVVLQQHGHIILGCRGGKLVIHLPRLQESLHLLLPVYGHPSLQRHHLVLDHRLRRALHLQDIRRLADLLAVTLQAPDGILRHTIQVSAERLLLPPQAFDVAPQMLLRLRRKRIRVRVGLRRRAGKRHGDEIGLPALLVHHHGIVLLLPLRQVFPARHGEEAHVPAGCRQPVHPLPGETPPRLVERRFLFQGAQFLGNPLLAEHLLLQGEQQLFPLRVRPLPFRPLLRSPALQQANHLVHPLHQTQFGLQGLILRRPLLVLVNMNHSPFPKFLEKRLIILMVYQQG